MPPPFRFPLFWCLSQVFKSNKWSTSLHNAATHKHTPLAKHFKPNSIQDYILKWLLTFVHRYSQCHFSVGFRHSLCNVSSLASGSSFLVSWQSPWATLWPKQMQSWWKLQLDQNNWAAGSAWQDREDQTAVKQRTFRNLFSNAQPLLWGTVHGLNLEK